MIKRDFNEDISNLLEPKKKEIKKEIKIKEGEYGPLKRVLIIGPNYPERCHFSENIYDLWNEDPNYEIKIIGDTELPVNSMHIQKGLELQLSVVIEKLEEWKPQLVIYDQVNVNFMNDLQVPVFYHHRNYYRDVRMFYPTVVYFWHDELLKYYETRFKVNWMAQIPFKDVMYIPVNPKRYKPEKKIYKGVNGIGFREPPSFAYEINDLFELGPVRLLEQEYNKFIELGFNMFETPIMDDEYRELLPKCEALWIPLSAGQYTSRRMIEAMACKTLCILKLESKIHEKVLQKMGFYNGEHYIGVDRLDEIEQAFIETTNKKEIIENAYSQVLNNHTYQNRIEQIIKKYEEITNTP